MKRMGLAVMCIAVAAAAAAQAVEPKAPGRVIWTDPLYLSSGMLTATLEWRVADSLTISGGLLAGGTFQQALGGVGVSEASISGGASLGASWFPFGRAPSGFWIGPRFRGSAEDRQSSLFTLNGPRTEIHDLRSTISGSVLLGYSAVFSSGLSLRAGGGLGPTLERWRSLPPGGAGIDATTVAMRLQLELSIGYAF